MKRLLFELQLIALFAASGVHAAENAGLCFGPILEMLTHSKLGELKYGQEIEIQVGGTSQVWKGKYLRLDDSDPQRKLYAFEVTTPDGPLEISVPREQVQFVETIHPVKPDRFRETVKLLWDGGTYAMGIPFATVRRVADSARKFPQVVRGADFVIEAGKGIDPQVLSRIKDQVEAVDRKARIWGFERPRLTSFQFAPNYEHTAEAMLKPRFNLKEGKFRNVVYFRDYTRGKGDFVPEILAHERMHNYYFNQYRVSAWLNKAPGVQEGLADFGAAHINDNPKFGPQRDISRGWSEWAQKYATFEGHRVLIPPQEASLPISQALWKLREKVGVENIDALIKPMSDNLNAHRASYERWLAQKDPKNTSDRLQHSYRQKYLSDLEYFAASLLKTTGTTPIAAQTREVIYSFITNYHLDPRRIQELQSILTPAKPETFLYSAAEVWRPILIQDTRDFLIITGGAAAAWTYLNSNQ